MKKNIFIICALVWSAAHTTTHATISNRFYGFTAMALAYTLDQGPAWTRRGIARYNLTFTRQALQSAMLEEPLARFFASRKLYRFALSCIPLIGKHVRCTNKQCQSVCNDCKLKFLYTELPIQMMMLHTRQAVVQNTSDDFINGAEIGATWLWCVVNIFSKIVNHAAEATDSTAHANKPDEPNETDGTGSHSANTQEKNDGDSDSDNDDDNDE
jgi:hypothetical protein